MSKFINKENVVLNMNYKPFHSGISLNFNSQSSNGSIVTNDSRSGDIECCISIGSLLKIYMYNFIKQIKYEILNDYYYHFMKLEL